MRQTRKIVIIGFLHWNVYYANDLQYYSIYDNNIFCNKYFILVNKCTVAGNW